MKRFGYDENSVSVFVGFCHNSMELVYLVSALTTFLLLSLSKLHDETFKWFSCVYSSISVIFTVVVNVLLLRAYAFGEGNENIVMYYRMLVLANLAAGIDDMCISTIAADCLSQYDFGQAMIGIVVSLFHWIAFKMLIMLEKDVNYWLIVSQLIFITMLSAIAAVVWIWYLIQENIMGNGTKNKVECSQAGNLGKGISQTLPMIVICTVGYGIIYVVYPLISPFEMVDFPHHYPIQRACLIFHAISGLTVWVIDMSGGLKDSWYKGKMAWLHLIWLLLIPFIGTAVLFIYCMHYPDSLFGRAIINRPMVVGCLTVIYYYTARFTTGISYVAIDANGDGKGQILSAVNLAINLVSLNAIKYISEAYIQQFRITKRNCKNGQPWPTDGMTTFSAFVYWCRIGTEHGFKNFRELSSADVKQLLKNTQGHQP